MNKKLSRLISMVLAMVMTLSCFVCSSVEALAADQSTNVNYTLSQDGTTATWKFDKAPSSNVSISANDTLSGIVAKTATSIKSSTGYLGLNKGSEILVPVPAGSAGNIAVTSNRNDSKRTIGFGTTTITQSSSANSASFASSDITTVDGSSYLDLTVAGGEYQIAEISITLTTGSYNTGGDVDSGPFDCTINVTNEASTDATIVINDNNFKTTANSSDSHTITLDNGNYPITLLPGTEDTYTLVDSEGNANPSLTVDGSAASINVTIKDIYFTALVNVANATDKDLEVKLVGNDSTETTPQTVKANSQSTEYSFPKLNAYDDSGAEIVYTVYVGNEVVGTVFYSEAKLSNINITTTTTTTESTSEATTEATTVDLSKNVVVYNSDGTAVGSYATIQAAVNAETTVENCVIQVKPGNYVEQVRVPATVTVNKKKISKKGITIKKAEGTTGDVVIYYDTTKSGAYTGPAKMYPIVHIEADNVTLSDLTIINPYNVNVGDVTAKDTIEKRAALAVEGNNGTYNNLVLTSVQDTVFLNQKSTNTNTFNNCTIKGATDWICGGGVNVFNDCNFVFYTGDGAQKKNIGYVFAVGTKGNYTVNGGTLSSELPNAASANYYYARAWQDSTPSTDADYPVLHIFALDNQLPTTFGTSGLLGFYGLTGGNTDNYTGYLLKCDFRAYAGTDTNSELIGTVDPSVLSGLISMNDVSEYKFESNENRLLVADYGNQYKTLTRNSIVDAKTYGFVLFENADDATEANAKKQIEAGNAIESTTLFNTIATESGKTYSLADNKTPGTAADGKYFGVGIVKSDTDLTNETVTVIPYIAFDGSYNVGGTDYDTNITYCFGTAKTITFE